MDTQSIKAVVKGIFDGNVQVARGRATYLRELAKATQEALGGKRGQDERTQLGALNQTHNAFYQVVVETAEEYVPKGTKDRSAELHRMGTFARTSATALRNHVRAGGDICALKAAEVVKTRLKVPKVAAHPASARRLKGAAERQTTALLATVENLGRADKEAAAAALRLIIDEASKQLLAFNVKKNGKAANDSKVEHQVAA